MRFPVNRRLSLAALVFLAGCGGGGRAVHLQAQPQNGPAADYPVVLGDPFTIADRTWTPVDQLNFDAVGHASVSTEEHSGVTAAHKTLPLPSYAEVTSLDTGRTALVRVERRGPMVNDTLVELSQAAARQLGISPGSRVAVRMRRTNPSEQERAALRSGAQAPERMRTPEPLLKVLRRKLVEQSPLAAPASMPRPGAEEASDTTAPALSQARKTAVPGAINAQPAPAIPQPAASASKGALVVQVAAFSVETNANKLAAQLNGFVSKPGRYWLVRVGPFANRAQAAPVLEKARTAGYRDARIQLAD